MHQCRAHWPDDHISWQDGRRCKFLLKQNDDGDHYCPVHGVQSVPKFETQNDVDAGEQEGLDAFA